MFEIKGTYNVAKVFAEKIDKNTEQQILDLCDQEWLQGCKIAIQADTHAGAGCTVGTTIALKNKVCPFTTGVDLGCGMLVIEMPNNLTLNLPKIDDFINKNIPYGFDINENYQISNLELELMLKKLKCFNKIKNLDAIKKSLGSLGHGNHFIEIDVDKNNKKYLVIHSGSRNLGNQIAKIYQDIADEYCNHVKSDKLNKRNNIIKTLKQQGRYQEIEDHLIEFNKNYKVVRKIPYELCYIEGQDMLDYLNDSKICNEYAKLSRISMAKRTLEFIVTENLSNISNNEIEGLNVWIDEYQKDKFEFGYENRNIDVRTFGFQTVHNYIGEDKILRKGAISTRKNEKVIIPINMRDGSIIGIGKGNPEYNFSGPHGAGRLLSRKEAFDNLNVENYKNEMVGIYSTSVNKSTLDEAPMVYKSIKSILKNIDETVEVVDIIKPIYNFKAH